MTDAHHVVIPTRADLEKTLAQVQDEEPSEDRTEAIAKLKAQIADLPKMHASLGVNADGSPKSAA